MRSSFLFLLCLLLPISTSATNSPEKVLICGICRNVEPTVKNSIKNIEALGSQFADYAVIIYENNSSDQTAMLFSKWAKNNPRVTFLSEKIRSHDLPASRTEKIARARNRALKEAKKQKYKNFKYLVMVDLDFTKAWPIDEIVETTLSQVDWDCVSANGVCRDGRYYDLYAFRDQNFILNHELLGYGKSINLILSKNQWHPVYSAFGGLAIYKTAIVTQFGYQGTVTGDLEKYYNQLFMKLTNKNSEVQKYLKLNPVPSKSSLESIKIHFRHNSPKEHPKNYPLITCCEHLNLHAAMALRGHDKFFINPKMKMYYNR